MKRALYCLLAIAVTCCLPISARVITPQEAQTTALNLIDVVDGNGSAQVSQNILTVLSKVDGTTPVFYVFNIFERFPSNGKYVIIESVSGTVLAYGDGLLDVNNIPEAMQSLLDYYQEQMDQLLVNNDVRSGYRSSSIPSFEVEVVVPYLLTTEWGQRAPYNILCPVDSTGQHCVTGCGATALAQVMKKWHYPQSEVGPISGYTCGDIVVEDIAGIQFDWENMIDSYRGSHTEVQDTAVAVLMRYVGQALETFYGVNESYSKLSAFIPALNRFGYEATNWQKSGINAVGEDLWKEKMISELESGRPIIYYAAAGGKAHFFVVDGYGTCNGETMFHINWGWNGDDYNTNNTNYNNKGYYALNHFKLKDLEYNKSQQMFVDIMPTEMLPPEVTVDSLSLSFEELTGYTQKKSFIIRCNGLNDNIELSISDDNDHVFDLDVNTITPEQAHHGVVKVTVGYSPKTSGITSASVNIESEVGQFSVGLAGKATLSNTIVYVDDSSLSFADGHTGYAQTQTVTGSAFIDCIEDDGTVNSIPLRNNVTLMMDNVGASSPFKVISPITISPQQAYEGFSVTVEYNPQNDGEATGTIILSTPNNSFDDPVIQLYGKANSEPGIRSSASSLSFNNWHTNYEKSKTIIVSAYHTTGDINLTLGDPNGPFTISPTIIPAERAGDGVPVTVTYLPNEDGEHSTTLTLTNSTADAVTINLSGNANSSPYIEVDSTGLSFEEYKGYTQTKTFTVKGYNLTNDVTLTKTGGGRSFFHVTPSRINREDAEQSAIVSVEFRPISNLTKDLQATVNLSSSNSETVTVGLYGHSIKSSYYLSVDTTSLFMNTTLGQPVSQSIILTIRKDKDFPGGSFDGDVRTSSCSSGNGENTEMNGDQLRFVRHGKINPLALVYLGTHAIIDGDEGFELDVPCYYWKELDENVYSIGKGMLPISGIMTFTVPVIFNPRNPKDLNYDANVTFYLSGAKPVTVALTGIAEIQEMLGDVNGDGAVTIADMTVLIDYLLSKKADGLYLENADCNLDGIIDINDVAILIDMLLGT